MPRQNRTRIVFAGLAFAAASGAAVWLFAPAAPPAPQLSQAPSPATSAANSVESPTVESAETTAVDTDVTTGAVTAAYAPAQARPDPFASLSVAKLKGGLEALAANDLAAARVARDNLPAASLDHRILTWAIATSDGNDVPSGEIARAARELAGWPGIAALRSHSERAMYREDPGPRVVLDAFGSSRAETAEGAMLLARAHLAVGNADAARAVLSQIWRTEKLDARAETAMIREFGGVISEADHRFRMERMLYADRLRSAERVAELADAPELAKAFAAVTRNEKNAGKLLEAVPKDQRSAAYIFAEARHLRRTGKYREAAAVMLKAPTEAEALVDPDAWWVERRVLSRELLDLDDPAGAYEIAAAHAAESPALAADAEFHAGWYALRGQDDPETAARHFARIAEIAEGPISLSRAYYWLGRAAEAGGPGEAKAHYERAAVYGTAFYGQLAAAKLGRNLAAAGNPSPSDEDRDAFAGREAVQAIRRIEEAGQPVRAYPLYQALAQELQSIGELALLSEMAEKRDNHYLALRIGKWAAARGLDVGGLSHPVGAIPAEADISGAGKALAYAIARQESEFNVSARSGAGALGLLQLLPGTAQDMARKAGLGYSQGKLTTDAGYNATLGSHYLDEQLARFSGSYVLTFAGYNAGPGRARDWMERYGDPRGKDIDTVVDWIERIPFTETRSYVQRVMENYQVYKMRLTGRMDIATDLVDGR